MAEWAYRVGVLLEPGDRLTRNRRAIGDGMAQVVDPSDGGNGSPLAHPCIDRRTPRQSLTVLSGNEPRQAWGDAPRRQFVTTLSGAVEIECGDGSVRRLGPGDVLLADDTTGQGHVSREVEAPRRTVLVPLPDDLDLSRWPTSDSEAGQGPVT